MKKTTFDFLIKEAQEKERYFQDYLYWARMIKKVAEEVLGTVRVFVFGSILKPDEVPRVIDILIVSTRLKDARNKSKLITGIWEKLAISSPFEIHLVTPKEYQNWYRFFIREKIEV